MKKVFNIQSLDFKKICNDFETQGWTKIAPSEEVKRIYFNFLKHSHEFFDRGSELNSKLVNPDGLVFPGFLTYPGGRDGYFQDTTEMYHVSLFEESKSGPDNIKSFKRYGNAWPTELPQFKSAFIEMRDYFYNLSKEVLSAVEKYYEINSGEITELIEDGWSMQRAMRYHPTHDPSRVGGLTVGEHRDTSLLTLTFGGSQPGLELKNTEGDWVGVCGKSADVIVGVGGMLELITNGNFKNMFHRVKYVEETVEASRVSSPFFCWPKPESVLKPHEKIMRKHNQNIRFPTQLAIRHLEQNLMVPFSYQEDSEIIDQYMLKKKKVA